MDRLPDDARRLLERAQAADAPGAGERERVWAALEAQLALTGTDVTQARGEGAPGPTDPASAAGGGGATGSGGASGLGAKVTLGLAALGLALAVGVGLATERGEPAPAPVSTPAGTATSDGEPTREASHAAREGSSRAREASAGTGGSADHAGVTAESARMADDDAQDTAASGDGVPALEGASATPRERASALAPSAPAGDDIAADVALLHEAQSAWRAGRAGEALQLAERHRATFPRSALGRERDAIRVLALCALGREESARRIATRLLATSGASPWRQAVAESCGGR